MPVTAIGSRTSLSSGRGRRLSQAVTAGLALTVVVNVLTVVPGWAAPKPTPGANGAPSKSVPVTPGKARPAQRSQTDVAARTDRTTLPKAATADVPVSGSPVKVGDLGVTVSATAPRDIDALRPGLKARAAGPTSVRVAVADRAASAAAGVSGTLLTLSRSDKAAIGDRVKVQLDYSGFTNAYGGNYGSRLRLEALPGCALTTPQRVECQTRTPLVSVNDELAGTVSAEVPVPADPAAPGLTAQAVAAAAPMVVALAAGPSSGNGNYGATSLSPAYAWAAGSQGGTFTYNYPLKVPASLGGPAPQLALSYDSGSVDAQTRAQNGQASVVGEGWAGVAENYIERSYRPCAQDDGPANSGDLCEFSKHNATMVFNGRSTALVRDEGSGVWHARDDSGLKVEQLFDTSLGNGDQRGEHWRVTTLDGTQYYMGRHKRYAGDPVSTESVQTVLVYGNHANEPCHNPRGFGWSGCNRGYRWNLDYVVDPRGNTMTYFYEKMRGFYGANNNTYISEYILAAWLDRVEYGTRAGSEGAGPAPMQVRFDKGERCRDACRVGAADYPDTPFDLFCGSSSSCPHLTGPAFWIRNRLAGVHTRVWNAAAGDYRKVDQWELRHVFPPSGNALGGAQDDTSPNLWLQTITHRGFGADGSSSLAEPTVEFGGVRLDNRKNWSRYEGVAPNRHFRIEIVNPGTGSETKVTYSDPECPNWARRDDGTSPPGAWDPQPSANPHRCFPVWYQSPTNGSGWDWSHKYVVSSVTTRDLTGGSPDQTWSYEYSTEGSSDAALWRHDMAESVKLAYRSWPQWQGYSMVTTRHGPAGGSQTTSRTRYHRGFDGDGLPSTDNQAMVWNARRVGLLSPLTTPGVTGAISGRTGLCLHTPGGNLGPGQRTITGNCTGEPAQVWRYHWPDQTVRNQASGLCLDVADGNTGDGTPVQTWHCNGHPAQRWQRTPEGGLRNPHAGRCLDVPGGSHAAGTALAVHVCNGSSAQIWQPQANGTMSNPQSARCVDVIDAGTGNHHPIMIHACNGTAAQVFETGPEQSLRNPNSGRCLDIAAGPGVTNAPIQLYDCNGTWAQRWVQQDDGTLLNPLSGLCLWAEALATRLRLRDCTPTPDKQFTGRIVDADGLHGAVHEEFTLDGGQVKASTVHQHTVARTAWRPKPSDAGEDLTARMATETSTRTRTWIAATQSWRWTRTDTSYDQYGLPVDVKDHGDLATGDDDTCTHTDYARDVPRGMIDFVSQSVTTNCAGAPSGGDFLAGSQTLYDDATAVGAAPSKGLPTRTLALASVNGTAKTWKQAGRVGYDNHGRVTSAWDALDRRTTTAYTPTSGGPVTETVMTNAAGHTARTRVDHRGTPTTVTDANDKTTTITYDPLGRLTKVWLPGRATNQTPDLEYGYVLRGDGANAVVTRKLGPAGNQVASYELYDGLLRPRQAQSPAPQANGGRNIVDTAYDARGLAVKTSTFWNNAGGPSDTLVTFNDADVRNQRRVDHDALGRPVTEALWSANAKLWQSETGYDGDRVSVTPPRGGVATTTISNAAGKPVELRQYLAGYPSGEFQATRYDYDRLDRLTRVTDPAGNAWTTGYDLRGRVVSTSDPDKGVSAMTYDDAGQLLTSKDARGVTLAFAYDQLGRKTGLFEGSTSGTKRADWVYDTLAKGQLTRSTRYVGGDGYVTAVTGYDDRYRALGSAVTIPLSQGQLAGTYTSTSTYHVNGLVASTTFPAAGGLPAETVTNTYDAVGNPLTATGLDPYVSATSYYPWGAAHQRILGGGAKRVRSTSVLDEATGRLTTSSTDTENPAAAGSWVEKLTESYTYDPAGNVRSIRETSGSATVSNQCFGYNGLRELTEAWTTTAAGCQDAPSQGVVGGPEAYWSSYTYSPIGNRLTETKHAAGGDTTRTYGYPARGQAQPHTVRSVTSAGAVSGTDSFSYDATGNTLTRNVAGRPGQTLTWDAEGHLATLTDSTGTSAYLYSADGARLVGTDPTGTTVYLGGFELRRTADGVSCTRYYGVAVRTPGGLVWQASDHHGTAQLSIKADDLGTTRRRLDPFGNPRSTPLPAWPTTRGFVNGTADPSGLTHLGAREYDPAIGRFISVDPIMDNADPQHMNGYTYANNTPVVMSDPDGLEPRPWHNPNFDGKTFNYDRYFHYEQRAFNRKGLPGPKQGGKGKPPSHTINAKTRVSCPKCTTISDIMSSDRDDWVINGRYYTREQLIDQTQGLGGQDQDDQLCILGLVSCAFAESIHPNGAHPCGYGSQNAACNAAVLTMEQAFADAVVFGGGMGSRVRNPRVARRCNSFHPDTLVLMADGTHKAIKDVKVGDRVMATDPENGFHGDERVTRLHDNLDTELAVVAVVNAADQESVLRTTAHHEFWEIGTRQWLDATELRPGHILGGPARETARVTAVVPSTGQQRMLDLTVANIHTYYVMAGDTPVLVHNDDGPPIDLNGKSYTVWRGGPYRIDIEARNGAKQMHFQVQINGVSSGDAPKYQYNPRTGGFDGMPRSLQKDLAKNYPEYQKGLSRGAAVFDRVIGTC